MTGDPGFDFGPRRHPRRMSLTPMIDVVFLLLIFFMLASRFGMDGALPIAGGAAGGTGSEWQGVPRLIDIAPGGVALNGVAMSEADLFQALAPLMPEEDAPVILRAQDQADLQRLVAVMDALRAQGFTNLVLIE